MIPLGILASAGAAPAGAFELISTTVLGANTTTVTLSSIPQTYRHLQIRFVIRGAGTGTNGNFWVRANGLTSGFAWHWLRSTGSNVTSGGGGTQTTMRVGNYSGVSSWDEWAVGVMDILDYASTSKNKTFRTFTGNSSSGASAVVLSSQFLPSTSGLTTIEFAGDSSGFNTGSRFSIYGIKGA